MGPHTIAKLATLAVGVALASLLGCGGATAPGDSGGATAPVDSGGGAAANAGGPAATPSDAAVPGPTTLFDASPVTPWAGWPVPNPPSSQLPHPQVYSTSVPGVVRDAVTQLEWQTSVDGVTREWNEAVSYCATLANDSGGWRLPSRMELVSIVDWTQTLGIDVAAFGPLPAPSTSPGTQALLYWSTSRRAGDSTQAWAVDFGSGVDLVLPDATTNLHYVRCVRGP
jgi:hypothetical protein